MCEYVLDTKFQYEQFFKISLTESIYTLRNPHSNYRDPLVQHNEKKSKHLYSYPIPQKPTLRSKGI